jgi:hypothetical protein
MNRSLFTVRRALNCVGIVDTRLILQQQSRHSKLFESSIKSFSSTSNNIFQSKQLKSYRNSNLNENILQQSRQFDNMWLANARISTHARSQLLAGKRYYTGLPLQNNRAMIEKKRRSSSSIATLQHTRHLSHNAKLGIGAASLGALVLFVGPMKVLGSIVAASGYLLFGVLVTGGTVYYAARRLATPPALRSPTAPWAIGGGALLVLMIGPGLVAKVGAYASLGGLAALLVAGAIARKRLMRCVCVCVSACHRTEMLLFYKYIL